VDLLIAVGVVVVDEGGQGFCSAGVREGVGNRVLELKIECFPFLKEGGSRGQFLLRIRNEEVVIIVVESVDDGGGVGCKKLTSRDFA